MAAIGTALGGVARFSRRKAEDSRQSRRADLVTEFSDLLEEAVDEADRVARELETPGERDTLASDEIEEELAETEEDTRALVASVEVFTTVHPDVWEAFEEILDSHLTKSDESSRALSKRYFLWGVFFTFFASIFVSAAFFFLTQ